MSSSPPNPELLDAAGPLAAPDLKNDLKATAEANAASPGRRRTVRPSRFGLALVALFASTSLFVGGFSLGSHVANTPGTPADQESRFSAFWDVYQLIQSDYAGYSGDNKPTQDQLVQAAIDGMIKSLNDPWSVYQAPDDFKNSLLSVGGQTEGIGVAPKLQRIDPTSNEACKAIGNGCEFAVAQVITDSPAEAAGMKAGDVIVSVDGASLDGKTQDQAIALIKGPKDTTVVLGLTRAGKAIDLTIVRKVFSLPEVVTKSLANGQVAYIAVNGMNQPASSQFDLALANAITAGQKNIIMDLRGNLGGYVDDAVKIASEFIPNGTIVWQEDAAGKLTEVTARPDGRATDSSYHLVVLVDGNTASAAEILAGALQARGRAKLVGAKTYGKGVVQEWLPLPNNMGGIHLTVAKWLLPDANKTWIGNGQNGAGLKPDVPIDSSNARAGTDPVLDAGLTALGFPPTSTPTSAPTSTPTSAPTAGPTSTP